MKKKWFVLGYKSKSVNVIPYTNRLIDKLYDVFKPIEASFENTIVNILIKW